MAADQQPHTPSAPALANPDKDTFFVLMTFHASNKLTNSDPFAANK